MLKNIILPFILCFTFCHSVRWSVDSYPDPQRSPYSRCGNNYKSQLCDADEILTEAQRDELKENIEELQHETTRTQSTLSRCEKAGVNLFIALMDRIDFPGPQITDSDVKAFASQLQKNWHLDMNCKDVIIVLIVGDRKFYTHQADELTDTFPKGVIQDFLNDEETNYMRSRYGDALYNIIHKIENYYNANVKEAPVITTEEEAAPVINTEEEAAPVITTEEEAAPVITTDQEAANSTAEKDEKKGKQKTVHLDVPPWVWILIAVILVSSCCCCCFFMICQSIRECLCPCCDDEEHRGEQKIGLPSKVKEKLPFVDRNRDAADSHVAGYHKPHHDDPLVYQPTTEPVDKGEGVGGGGGWGPPPETEKDRLVTQPPSRSGRDTGEGVGGGGGW